MPYDIFISYARNDNINGNLTKLKKEIENSYLRYNI